MKDSEYKKLADLCDGDRGVILRVEGSGPFHRRITEMGFVKNKVVEVIKNAPLQDPIEYRILGYNVSLRRSEARMIEVKPINGSHVQEEFKFEGILDGENIRVASNDKSKKINVAFVGNPNSGKTTLFNYASGSHERVGNYGGVTIDAKEATIRKKGYVFNVVDLPGTYSITEYTPEELFVRRYISEGNPDFVVNIVDASNLERNLFLTTQLIDMNVKVVIALNMFDELEHKGAILEYTKLGEMLGIPIIPTIAVRGKGINELINKIIEIHEGKDTTARNININYGSIIEDSIEKIQSELEKVKDLKEHISTRYLAVKLLEKDKVILSRLKGYSNYETICQVVDSEILKLEKEYGEETDTVITYNRYGFIAGALRETYTEQALSTDNKQWNIDNILTNKYWGFPVFIFFMWLMFQATFTIGSYPMEWIDTGVGYLSTIAGTVIPEGSLHDLITEGIIGGVGGVIIFLPNILILFFFISLMEDTGYMARVSFIMDRLMHKIGLHGKSFIPLLMGFGCNVPAIMATRTLENRKDRIMTMLIAPFMSCSARLPVYVLIISAFFPKYQGLVLFSVYIAGVVLAVLVALVLKKTVFAGKDVPFVMELPPYRLPTIRNTSRHMWHKGSQYLRKMGSFILLASIIIWGLSYYPRDVKYSTDYDTQIANLESNASFSGKSGQSEINELKLLKASEHQEQSYIGKLGRFIEPVIKPLGFDWKIGISIITGLAAKEIVVGSMAVLYHANLEGYEGSDNLIVKLRQQEYTSGVLKGQKVFTPLVAFGFMLFVLIYFPCVAVIAAIKKESNYRWAIFTMVYTTGIAWVVAFLTYQVGSIFI